MGLTKWTFNSFYFFFLFFVTVYANDYNLKQVLILSRHNIRAPLSSNLNFLSNNKWPTWSVDPGFLTPKGALLERYIGNYISNWLVKEGLLPNGCPQQNTIQVYANTKQRTRETAKAFVEGAFKNCNITVYSKNSSKMDSIFNPILRNDSQVLKNLITNEMRIKLAGVSATLQDVYSKLSEIVNLRNSKLCKVEHICDFAKLNDEIVYQVGEEPNIKGPLGFGNSIVDAFIMSYYEGMKLDDVAWGNMKSEKDRYSFAKITRGNLDVRFNNTHLAKEVAKPLLKYIYDTLVKGDSLKFALLVGHDSNINSVMAAIGVKPYSLPEQHEFTPIGSKLMFEKWHDKKNNKDFLKIEYVYQTVKQLRDGEILTDDNPPRRVTMQINDCNMNDEGFCPWDEFISVLGQSFKEA